MSRKMCSFFWEASPVCRMQGMGCHEDIVNHPPRPVCLCVCTRYGVFFRRRFSAIALPGSFAERRGQSLAASPDNSGAVSDVMRVTMHVHVSVRVCMHSIPTSWRSPSAEAYSSQLPPLRRRISPSEEERKRPLIQFVTAVITDLGGK